MSRASLRSFRLVNPSYIPNLATRRNLHASIVRQGAALDVREAEHGIEKANTPQPLRLPPRVTLARQKLQDLWDAVTAETRDPSMIWGCYVDLLNYVGPEDVPLELHQRTLRRCSPRPWDMRAWYARRLAAGKQLPSSHINEARFRSIIYNIRAAGYTPDIDDYNHILRHFAAVGYHSGALHVLREITSLGLPRSPKTYGLCLMALSRRLSLPCKKIFRDDIIQDVSEQCAKLLKDMWQDGIPVTAMNVDIAMRILKQSMDLDIFERIMRVAYAIDLAYPDRPPIELWDPSQGETSDSAEFPLQPPEPLPFTTSTLNTVVDFLGSARKISKLVQAFEVLTTPLASSSPAAPSSTFEDDEDDDFGDSNPSVAPYNPPTAEPNTTTYYFLIKWISKAGKATLARHYLLQAMELDRAEDRRLRGDCLLKSPGEILAPHFGVNRSMILPIYAEANRDKNMELLRWVLVKTQRVLRRKCADLQYYTEIEESWKAGAEAARTEAIDATGSLEVSPTSTASFTTPPAVSQTDAPSAQASSKPPPEASIGSPDVLDTDLDAPSQAPAPPKLFDIYKHLSILQRDRVQLEEFEKYITDTLGRNSQRVKERLGRRVWAKQNVYLRSVGMRTRISRIGWRQIVNFRPTPAHHDPEQPPETEGGPGHVAAFRGFFTSRKYQDLDPKPETSSTPDATKAE